LCGRAVSAEGEMLRSDQHDNLEITRDEGVGRDESRSYKGRRN
jgi:hypothetical protein